MTSFGLGRPRMWEFQYWRLQQFSLAVPVHVAPPKVQVGHAPPSHTHLRAGSHRERTYQESLYRRQRPHPRCSGPLPLTASWELSPTGERHPRKVSTGDKDPPLHPIPFPSPIPSPSQRQELLSRLTFFLERLFAGKEILFKILA